MHPKEKELACTKCHNQVAFTKPDKSRLAEKHFYYNGSAEEAQWNMLFPMKERDGSELCYICEKAEARLMKPMEKQEVDYAGILTY